MEQQHAETQERDVGICIMEQQQVDAVRIVRIDTLEGYQDHVRLQNIVWAGTPTEAVPSHLLLAAARNGAAVLGAYADEGATDAETGDGAMMVGALLSFPALHDGRHTHLSHMLAIHPDWRGRGIGPALKWRQRDLVLGQGIDRITWTYDPLEAVNARLNLTRLGGYTRSYVRDYYGAMDDELNQGLPSDRLVVTWRLDAARVRARASGGLVEPTVAGLPIALDTTPDARGLPRPLPYTAPAGPAALVAIPPRMRDIRRRDAGLSLEWRLAVRAALEHLFAAGYTATAVARQGQQPFYLLEQDALDTDCLIAHGLAE